MTENKYSAFVSNVRYEFQRRVVLQLLVCHIFGNFDHKFHIFCVFECESLMQKFCTTTMIRMRTAALVDVHFVFCRVFNLKVDRSTRSSTVNRIMKAKTMALFKHQYSLSTDSSDTDGQDRFSPLLQQSCQLLYIQQYNVIPAEPL